VNINIGEASRWAPAWNKVLRDSSEKVFRETIKKKDSVPIRPIITRFNKLKHDVAHGGQNQDPFSDPHSIVYGLLLLLRRGKRIRSPPLLRSTSTNKRQCRLGQEPDMPPKTSSGIRHSGV